MFFPESGQEKLPHISVPDWKRNGDFGPKEHADVSEREGEWSSGCSQREHS